jgi:hypothetical protein
MNQRQRCLTPDAKIVIRHQDGLGERARNNGGGHFRQRIDSLQHQVDYIIIVGENTKANSLQVGQQHLDLSATD